MGRVEEAMRRAAEATEVARGQDVSATEIHSGEARATVRLENFPSEAPEPHRRLRPAKVEPPTRSAAAMLAALVERMLPSLAKKIVVDNDIDPISREQYRRLATRLHAAQGAAGLKVIAISSAVASEGKSLTASNLALTLSESYARSVLLIDGDLRRPAIGQVFGLSSGVGLSDAVQAETDPLLNLHQVTSHLSVLLAGRATVDPVAVLSSTRMGQLMIEARQMFDWVIIDTPPVGLLSDANLVADFTDGTLLVVKAETTPYEVVQRAVAALGRERILGVVLNQAPSAGPDNKYQNYYYTASQTQDPVT